MGALYTLHQWDYMYIAISVLLSIDSGTMSARRLSVKAKKRSINYIEISPSKRARRKSVSKSVNLQPIQLCYMNLDSSSDGNQMESNNENDDFDHGGELECTEPDTDQYARRKEKAANAWSDIRNQMLTVSVESLCLPLTTVCCSCGNAANIRCCDCGPLTFYCEECVEDTHTSRLFLHRVEIYKVINRVCA